MFLRRASSVLTDAYGRAALPLSYILGYESEMRYVDINLFTGKRSQGRTADALAHGGDEGRDKLR